MTDAADLEQAMIDNAAGPQSAALDGQSATAHNLRDQIELDKYLASKAAARAKKPGFRFSKFTPPGMTD